MLKYMDYTSVLSVTLSSLLLSFNAQEKCHSEMGSTFKGFVVVVVVVVALLFYVHGKHLRSCRDGQLT